LAPGKGLWKRSLEKVSGKRSYEQALRISSSEKVFKGGLYGKGTDFLR
jgi:hypothetical protein